MIAAEDAPIHHKAGRELRQTGFGSAPFGTDGGWPSRLGLTVALRPVDRGRPQAERTPPVAEFAGRAT
jgi:hypothetical protein